MTYNFVLILNRDIDDATANQLFDAGLSDAAVTYFEGHPALDVDREAPTFSAAVTSAIREAESVQDVQVTRITNNDVITSS